MNIKIKYLRHKVKNKNYYSNRLNQLIAHKAMLDKRFIIFKLGGIVGDRIWDLEGGAYLDYFYRINPILRKRMEWYCKKMRKEEQNEAQANT